MVLTLSNVSPSYDYQTKDRLAVLKIFPTDEDTTSLQVQQFRKRTFCQISAESSLPNL
ncbi:hypothetical protein [Kamptonema sp. UHCC 0994]|uniref:hypothetical protein n=1 Tax=Kamptonema sp. UHCC 0994 TaxID=3031329 RepID=UPI0023B96703|nr:hypothetical protein [Kamptonema sp. UHCC 0994]MDF0555889.1 hypothetical protein [Kamptonema sp. UHCC 0994]